MARVAISEKTGLVSINPHENIITSQINIKDINNLEEEIKKLTNQYNRIEKKQKLFSWRKINGRKR